MSKEAELGARVSTNHLLEGLVNGPKPADVGAGCEEDEPEKGQAKVGGSPASDQPRETAHQVHGQRDAVHCRPRSTYTETDTSMHTDTRPMQRYMSTQTGTHTPITQHRPKHMQMAQEQRCSTYKHACNHIYTHS